jgi:hypothetical protein
VISVLGPNELEIGGWSGAGDHDFTYGENYVITTESRRYDTLGYEMLTGTRIAETYERDGNTGAYGYNFSSVEHIKSAPFDIEIEDSVGLTSTEFTVGVVNATGVAEVGIGEMSFWNYAPLRKLDYSTSDISFALDFATQYTITAASASTDYFIISGDHTSTFAAGDEIAVWDSTGNDGFWIVDSVSPSGSNTRVDVTGDVTDGTNDGYLTLVDLLNRVFSAKLEDGRLVKFQINYLPVNSEAWRVGGIDYVIYEGI